MPRSGRDLSLTSAAALAAACAAAALGAQEALDDVAMSAILGGLIFVTLVPLCRSPGVETTRAGVRGVGSGS
jgi:hypothetical protein